jgi:hypothetical protein
VEAVETSHRFLQMFWPQCLKVSQQSRRKRIVANILRAVAAESSH